MTNIAVSDEPDFDERQQQILWRARSWSSQAMFASCVILYVIAPLVALDVETAVVYIMCIGAIAEVVALIRQRAYTEIVKIRQAMFQRPRTLALWTGVMFLTAFLKRNISKGEITWTSTIILIGLATLASVLAYLFMRASSRQRIPR